MFVNILGVCSGLAHPSCHVLYSVQQTLWCRCTALFGFLNPDLRFVPFSFECSELQTECMSLITHPACSHLCNQFVPGIYFALQKSARLLGLWLCLLNAFLLSRIWGCVVTCIQQAHTDLYCWAAVVHSLELPRVVTILLHNVTLDLESIIS